MSSVQSDLLKYFDELHSDYNKQTPWYDNEEILVKCATTAKHLVEHYPNSRQSLLKSKIQHY